MEVFTFNADQGNESIEEFNQRLSDFCGQEDAPIVGVVPSVVGGAIVVALVASEDISVQMTLALMPIVYPLTVNDMLDLENVLGNFMERIRSDKVHPREPIELRVMEAKAASVVGYAVAVVCVGELAEAPGTEPAEGDE